MVAKRIGWIDFIRGCCVFLVIMGHIWKGTYFHLFVNSFKMPMFYILAGLFIKPDKELLTYVRDCLFRICIPWLIFSFIWLKLPYYAAQGNWSDLKSCLEDFLLGRDFWFIPSFFISQCLFYFICKVCRGKKFYLLLVSVICFLIGYFVNVSILRVWCIDTALTSLIFIYVGYLLKDNLNNLDQYALKYGLPVIILYLILYAIACFIRPTAALDFHNVEYGNLPINIIMIIFGNAAFLSLGIFFVKFFRCSFMQVLGRNTLVTYLLSFTGQAIIEKSTSLFHVDIASNIFFAFVSAIIICATGAVVSEICGYFLPWSIGLKKQPAINIINYFKRQ